MDKGVGSGVKSLQIQIKDPKLSPIIQVILETLKKVVKGQPMASARVGTSRMHVTIRLSQALVYIRPWYIF